MQGGCDVKTKAQKQIRKKIRGLGLILVVLMTAVIGLGVIRVLAGPQGESGNPTATQVTEAKQAKPTDPNVFKICFIAAAIAVAVGSIAAGGAVGYIGAAAMGAIGEKPELAGRALIYVGLAEGIAIYGLIIAIMILGKV